MGLIDVNMAKPMLFNFLDKLWQPSINGLSMVV
jgi:hypothetical protein